MAGQRSKHQSHQIPLNRLKIAQITETGEDSERTRKVKDFKKRFIVTPKTPGYMKGRMDMKEVRAQIALEKEKESKETPLPGKHASHISGVPGSGNNVLIT